MAAINTLLIQELSDWEKFDAALISLSSDEATVVNRVSSLEHLSDEQYLIEVVVSAVSGQANFGVEIYWKNSVEISDKALALHIAMMLKSPILVPDESLAPCAWLLILADGEVSKVNLDIDRLDDESVVAYTKS